jgi:predicted glycoside hydrolase/deacetylase ChbG (UPF0249 family)
MLIINADDLGMNELSTNRIIACYDRRLITSTTAMVFMLDTLRAAELAASRDIGVGLHLNFTTPFTNPPKNTNLNDHHLRIIKMFLSYRYYRYLYNPTLNNSIYYCFQAQYEEFLHVFGKQPSHIDGHHHIHLATNILFGRVLPPGVKIRKIRDVDYRPSLLGSLLRNRISRYIRNRFVTTDLFYPIFPLVDNRVAQKILKARFKNVELMVHPGEEYEFLYMNTDPYVGLMNIVSKGSYYDLNGTDDKTGKNNEER